MGGWWVNECMRLIASRRLRSSVLCVRNFAFVSRAVSSSRFVPPFVACSQANDVNYSAEFEGSDAIEAQFISFDGFDSINSPVSQQASRQANS